MTDQELLGQMRQSILDGDAEVAARLAEQAIVAGISPLEAIQEGYLVGLNEVGDLFARGEFFLPELVMSAEAMKAAVRVLEPEIRRRGEKQQQLGRVVIGSVEGDIHDIGKNLVAIMLSVGGFEVIDLGVDVKDEAFLQAAQDYEADLVGMSALLTTTMLHQRKVIELLEQAGLRKRVKVLVGGSPVTAAWAQEIGADGYAGDAIAAVQVARRLVGQE